MSDQAFAFQTGSRTCSGLQPDVDWAQCWGWGLVAGDGFQAHTDVGSLLESSFFSFPE